MVRRTFFGLGCQPLPTPSKTFDNLAVDLGKRDYKDDFASPPLRFLHFCQVTIEPGCLKFQVIKLTDQKTFAIADEFTLQKKP